MGFTVETSVSALAVFFQGLLSFFSPCVLPLIPLYLGYLAGGQGRAASKREQQRKPGQGAGLFEWSEVHGPPARAVGSPRKFAKQNFVGK